MRGLWLIGVAVSGLVASSASAAATLTHAYEFNGSGAEDSVGSADGALYGDASVSGGYLHLGGAGYVELAPIFPAWYESFSVFFSYKGHGPQSGYTEVVSQDGGSFYIGSDPAGNVRISDAYLGTSIAFPTGAGTHSFLLTNTASQSKLYIDGVDVFTGGPVASSPSGGSVARFGRQYGGWGEYFVGDIDTIRVFDGVATYAQASGVPEPAGWATMLGGFGLLGGALRRSRGPRGAIA